MMPVIDRQRHGEPDRRPPPRQELVAEDDRDHQQGDAVEDEQPGCGPDLVPVLREGHRAAPHRPAEEPRRDHPRVERIELPRPAGRGKFRVDDEQEAVHQEQAGDEDEKPLEPEVDRATGGRCRRRERAPRDEVDHHDGLEDVEDDPDVGERRLERVPVELLGVPVRGQQEGSREHEVAPHDPAEPQPAPLERRVEEEGRPEHVAGADERLREARLDVPGEVVRDELGEEEEPHREPGRSGGAEQTPAEACPSCHVHRSPSSPDRGAARSATDYASARSPVLDEPSADDLGGRRDAVRARSTAIIRPSG